MAYKPQEIMMEVYLLKHSLMMKPTPIIFTEIGHHMSNIKNILTGDLMDDESKMAQQVMALCVGGQKGLIPIFPNTDYSSFSN